MKKKLLLILSAVLLLLIAVLIGTRRPAPPIQATQAPTDRPDPSPTPAAEQITVYDPTCTEAGYELHEDPSSGTAYIIDGAPALGHDFSDGSVCARCGYEESQPTAPVADLPRIDLTGSMEGISKSHRITLDFSYESDAHRFDCCAYTTWQGHSSLDYPKKNYTIRLFTDETITEKYRLHFGGWQLEHKYILKANYTDATQARNLIAARIWGDIVSTRPDLPAPLFVSSNFGAVDGFPVTLWHDGAFQGLYTMNLHKDEDLYGMSGVVREAIMIANAQTMDESLFRAPAAFMEDESDWELEYCETDDGGAWAKDSFNDLIRFVMNSDDETFRSQLSSHLDTDSAIDYLLFLYLTGLEENAARDLVLIKYEDTPWIVTAYDMEAAFGLTRDGSAYRPTDAFLPAKENGLWSSGTDSLLWDRLLNVFEPEIRARYQALRKSILTEEALLARTDEYIGAIPPEYYRMDADLYPRSAAPGGRSARTDEDLHFRPSERTGQNFTGGC